jgi:beta-lactamase class D
MTIKWDSTQRPAPDWDHNLTMKNAFAISAVPYFQRVAEKIGKDAMQRWLDTLSYGTKKIKTTVSCLFSKFIRIH